MAYFSNGIQGMAYEEKYCCRCVHRHGSPPDLENGMCAVWLAHQLYNYEGVNPKDGEQPPSVRHVLDLLIPLDKKEGIWPEKCAMFYEDEHADQLGMSL